MIDNLEKYLQSFSQHICDIEDDKDKAFRQIESYFKSYTIEKMANMDIWEGFGY